MKTKTKRKAAQPENYSPILNQGYFITEDGIQFDDGTAYTSGELKKLKDIEPEHLRKIHYAKKLFKGVIL